MTPVLPPDDRITRELSAQVDGRYALERELGRGGMGAVYLARDLRLDRPVAIKVLPPELAVRAELRERFLREIRTTASFSHPNIVPVHAVEETPNLIYFVMGFVEGDTLTQRVRRQGPLPAPDAIRLLQELAWALSYAHSRGVIHRDIKPDNILIERATGRALVMDFGIARSVAVSGLTQMGETVGTPHFMSPEQAAGDKLDGRSDLYSLGVVAYFALTGRLPFDAESAQAILAMHLSRSPEPVTTFRPDLPPALAAAIDKCLAKDPADRFPSGEALVEAVAGLRSERRDVPPAIRLWVARADQFFRNGIMLLVFAQALIARARNGPEQLIMAAVLTVALIAIWSQLPIGLRDLARQGYRFPDLAAGLVAIDDERAAAQAALRAGPGYHLRRRRYTLLLLGTGLAGALSLVGFFMLWGSGAAGAAAERSQPRPPAGVAALGFVGMCLVFGAALFAIARSASQGRMERKIHRLWRGKAGALLYRLGASGMRETAAGDRAATAGAAVAAVTLLEALPAERRRGLSRLRETLERLGREAEAMTRRERELDQALVDAREAGTEASASRTRLIADLETARREAAERRQASLEALTDARIALIRLRSGLATPADVEREIGGRLGEVRSEE